MKIRLLEEGSIEAQLQAAIAERVDIPNGVAPLDENRKVPAVNSRVASVAGRGGDVTLGVADVAGALPATHTGEADPHAQYQRESEKGVAGGYAPLGGEAQPKIPLQFIPDTVLGGLDFQTAWDPATNTPNLQTIAKSKGDYWVASGSGSTNLGGITSWSNGDWAIWDGAAWSKLDRSITPAEILSLSRVRDESTLVDFATDIDFVGAGVIVDTYEATPGDASTRRIRVTVSGAAAGLASEAAPGIVEEATAAEVQNGSAGALFVSAAKQKAELDRRTSKVGAMPGGAGAYAINNVTVGPSTATVSGDLRGVNGVPADAQGVYAVVFASSQASGAPILAVDSADVSPSVFSPRIMAQAGAIVTGQLMIPLGAAGTNAGKIRLLSLSAGVSITGVYVWVTGWWK